MNESKQAGKAAYKEYKAERKRLGTEYKDKKGKSELMRLAAFYSKYGKLKEAVKYYLKALEFDKNDVEILVALNKLYIISKDFDKAYEAIFAAHGLAPDDLSVLEYLGTYYYLTERYDSALETFLRARSLENDNPRITEGLAYTYEAKKDYENAEKEYLKLIESEPDNSDAIHDFADFYVNSGRHEKAEKLLKALPGEASDEVKDC